MCHDDAILCDRLAPVRWRALIQPPQYFPPSWAASEAATRHRHAGSHTSPFPSFWYIGGGVKERTEALREYGHEVKTAQFAPTIADLPSDVRAERDPAKKRPNAKARKRRARQKATGNTAMGGQRAVADGREKKRRN